VAMCAFLLDERRGVVKCVLKNGVWVERNCGGGLVLLFTLSSFHPFTVVLSLR
jgi:hypothetical protein